MNKLSIADIIDKEAVLGSEWGMALVITADRAKELLADTMRENEELRRHPLKLICEKCGVLTDVNPNKESDNARD